MSRKRRFLPTGRLTGQGSSTLISDSAAPSRAMFFVKSGKKGRDKALPHKRCLQKLLFVILALFGCDRRERAEKAIGFVVGTGGEEQDGRRPGHVVIAKPEGP